MNGPSAAPSLRSPTIIMRLSANCATMVGVTKIPSEAGLVGPSNTSTITTFGRVVGAIRSSAAQRVFRARKERGDAPSNLEANVSWRDS